MEDGVLRFLESGNVHLVPGRQLHAPVEAAEDKRLRCLLQLLVREKVSDLGNVG